MIEGIILAGGKSSRMKQNKMLLPYLGKPLIYHTVQSMITYCNKITIVTGHYTEDYTSLFESDNKVHIIHNDQYQLGMFSSIKKAIKDVNSNIFIIPGDYPLVSKTTYEKLIQGDGLIRVPVCSGRRGHPIFISHNLVLDLKNEDISSNLKVWRDKHEVNYIEVKDEGIYKDIDTVSEYRQLLERTGS